MKVSIDFSYVPERQSEIHARLENWERWVKVRPHGWHTAPMFRQAQSNSRQWNPPEVKTPVNSLDALAIEKAVAALPEKHKAAIRWFYVYGGGPTKVARNLAMTLEMLFETVIDARFMLINTCKVVKTVAHC